MTNKNTKIENIHYGLDLTIFNEPQLTALHNWVLAKIGDLEEVENESLLEITTSSENNKITNKAIASVICEEKVFFAILAYKLTKQLSGETNNA